MFRFRTETFISLPLSYSLLRHTILTCWTQVLKHHFSYCTVLFKALLWLYIVHSIKCKLLTTFPRPPKSDQINCSVCFKHLPIMPSRTSPLILYACLFYPLLLFSCSNLLCWFKINSALFKRFWLTLALIYCFLFSLLHSKSGSPG